MQVAICIESNCNEPKVAGKPRCREHQRAMQRAYDRAAFLRKKGLTDRANLNFSELCRAIEMAAVYVTGYRSGTADRAIQLAQEMRRTVREDVTNGEKPTETKVLVHRGERLRLEGLTVGVR